MSEWAREWIRAYSPKVASFLYHSRRTTIWVMCLKYHKILCNSAKTVCLPAYHGFECLYASIHDPLTHSQMMLPTTTDFESSIHPRWHQSPSCEKIPRSNCDVQ